MSRATAAGATANARRQRAEHFAAFLPPLLVAAERVAATIEQGVHGRRRVGAGDAFWQFRRYSPGDPIARIDWRQTAKRPHPFIRENEWEAAESVWLWRDPSPSMRWKSSQAPEQKDMRADLLLLALASLLLRGGERIALLGNPERPATGRLVLERIAEQLLRARLNTAEASLPPAQSLPRYAHVVLIGDFLYPIPELAARLRAIADMGIKGTLMRLVDPAEEDFPYQGRTRFLGLEGETPLLVPRAESLADDWRTAFAAHQHDLAEVCRRLGWRHLKHGTDRPPQTALLALYQALQGERAGRANIIMR
ncbi:MAG TPA: DUF58 domain-containing protein [Ferrovibrio sp.]|uniref:DUF58 domain-containing protein n=1 Tax=Ferrovibrio sp. TaxID=1917215 RepID=UPI002ED4095B